MGNSTGEPTVTTIEDAVEKILPQEEEKNHDELLKDDDPAPEDDLTGEDDEDDSDDVVGDDDDEDSEDYDEDDEDEDGDDDQDEPFAETYTVKVDGEEHEVTLEDLKRGYSGQQYVQKGMQEAASQKKKVDELQQNLLRERQQVQQLLHMAQNGGLPQRPTPPDPKLAQTDPIGYMQAEAQYRQQAQEFNQAMQKVQAVRKQQEQADKASQQEMIKSEAQKLIAARPDFGDKNKAKKIREKLQSDGVQYGFTSEELANVTDHRAIMILQDAIAYREIQAGKKQAIEKSKGAKPVIKPGAKKNGGRKVSALKRRKSRLKKSGSIDDALGLIMNG